MLRELAHFLRHVPGAVRLKLRLDQAGLYRTLMDRADRAGLARERAALVTGVTGDVLEIGAGTGHMFPHYPAGARVIAIEPDAAFARTAVEAARSSAAGITVQLGDARALPFADQRFDVVVVALVLCSVPSIERVLAEIRRVLRPGGEVRLLEHVRSDRALPGLLMVAFNWLWRLLNGQGCNMHRRTLRALVDGGLRLEDVVPFQIWSPGLPAFPMRRIRAVVDVDRPRAS